MDQQHITDLATYDLKRGKVNHNDIGQMDLNVPHVIQEKHGKRSVILFFVVIANIKHQTTVTAGTIFEGTRKPLTLWFRAIWLVTSEKNGISALGLQRQLG